MKKITISIWFATFVIAHFSRSQTITETFGTEANEFSIEFVQVGNPGNAADTTGNPNPIGSVSYVYNIGKYEISQDAVNKANNGGALGITLFDLGSYGGNGLNKPATGVSWYEGARFVNWLNSTKGYTVAYKFDSNSNYQLWNPSDSGYDSSNPFRNSQARFYLPSLDEWYKAAYASPDGSWYNFPTGSDTPPTNVSSGTSPNTAVIGQNYWQGPADINNAGGLSAWGTMAQGGNVTEWMESSFDGSNDIAFETRERRGGLWYVNTSYSDASVRMSGGPSDEDGDSGFRIAMVPEPSALSLLAIGLGGLAMIRRRRKSRAVDTFVWSILLLVALSFPVRATVSLTDGLVGYYKFEGNFNDSSAVSNNLVPSTNASLTNDRFGNSNAAMSSTSSSYAYTSSNIGVSGFSSRTVSIWAKDSIDDSAFEYLHFGGGWNPLRPDGAGGNFAISYIPWKLTNPQRQWPEGISGNIYVDGNYWAYLVTTDPTSLGGLWHQLVYTFDSSDMLSSVYLNGVLQTSNAYSENVHLMNTIPSPLYLSSDGTTANVTIDDVRVYNRALSANEVQTLYATERIPEPSALSLIAIGLGGLAMMRRRRS